MRVVWGKGKAGVVVVMVVLVLGLGLGSRVWCTARLIGVW